MADERQLLEDARKLKSDAVATLFQNEYARLYRVAAALSGRLSTGRTIVRRVFARGVHLLPKWDATQHPEYWFRRYTTQLAREYSSRRPENAKDVLVENAPSREPAYLAFIGALRAMGDQQQEAFLLQHG